MLYMVSFHSSPEGSVNHTLLKKESLFGSSKVEELCFLQIPSFTLWKLSKAQRGALRILMASSGGFPGRAILFCSDLIYILSVDL